MFYWVLKLVLLGPVLRLVFRPRVEGEEHLPEDGAAILACNHLSYSDWLFMPLTIPRRVTFVAKAEYFNTPGVKGWLQKKFFSGAGQVPIDRSGADAAEGALSSAKRILDQGELFGIFPEGTRSHDGKLYRGKTGVARLALETRVPVIPVAVVGTDVVAPPGKKYGSYTRPVVRFGKPLDFSRYEGLENDRYILRSITDEIMYEIMRLSGQEYVDLYASRAKQLDKEAADKAKRAAVESPRLRPQGLLSRTGGRVVAEVDSAELRRVAEDLYGGAPGDFVATRAAAVKRLKGAGDKATAGAVAELRRPVQAAWAVNLLVREQGELVGQLLDLGASLREAQASLDADTLRELTRERRRVVARVTQAAASAVADEGQALSEAARRQVEDTLLAAVVDAELAEVLRSGLLVQPLSSTGMSSLADVQAIPGAARLELVRERPSSSAPKRKVSADDAEAVRGDDADGATEAEEREAARRETERAAEERRRTRERTRLRRVLETEQRAARTSASEVARLEQDVATARSRLARAEAELERASTKRESARERLAATEEALDALS